ncbi:MAG: hypothetical protein HYY49_05540, partial [Ignavibacteriales bacterium]|nr:hypothetical protein [Ignavibacteriales bacterium]
GSQVKAILLGADPGTTNDKRFKYVFKLEYGEQSSYFRQFIPNLTAIGVNLENLYVQNVCRNYFDRDTSMHGKDWLQCAKLWTESLRDELDNIGSLRSIPVLISAYIVLEAVSTRNVKKAEYYYSSRAFVKKNQNVLGRTLIPFFRGGRGKYRLNTMAAREYAMKIKTLIDMRNR